MFTLRRISGEGIEMNQFVGDGYTYINKEVNPKEFEESAQYYFDNAQVGDRGECYAFVCNGCFIQPLYKNQSNYIMTENGKTFANVSYR